MAKKNVGARHHAAKMTAAKVRSARKAYAEKKSSMAALARKYGITPQSMHAIIHRVTWKHVD